MNGTIEERVKLLPLQIIPIDGGAIIRRDTLQLHVRGDNVEDVLRAAFELLASGENTRAAVVTALSERFCEVPLNAIGALLDRLAAARLIQPAIDGVTDFVVEEPLDIYNWTYQAAPPQSQIAIFGRNHVGVGIAKALRESAGTDFALIAYPSLDDARLDDRSLDDLEVLSCEDWERSVAHAEIGCIVAASSFGIAPALREINSYAVRTRACFIPVYLAEHVGYVGPLVVPGESACLECVRARENSNLGDAALYRAVGERSREGQLVTGFHPLAVQVTARIGAMEAIKLSTPALRSTPIGSIVEVDLRVPSVSTRRALRMPRCSVCGSLNTISSTNPDKREYVPDLGDQE